MSIDPKFVELTADVLEIFLLNGVISDVLGLRSPAIQKKKCRKKVYLYRSTCPTVCFALVLAFFAADGVFLLSNLKLWPSESHVRVKTLGIELQYRIGQLQLSNYGL